MEKIYLDYASTTPLHPQVFEAMKNYFIEDFGNPSSVHLFGQKAEAAVENARGKIASLINSKPSEVIFTSCGTESNNLALKGVALASRKERGANHILISPVEHHAVSASAMQLKNIYGFEVELLPVDKHGSVSLKSVRKMIRTDTAIVSAIYANNEIGTINPVSDIGAICKENGIPFHTDAMQAGAFLSLNVKELNVDLMTLGAHKLYGPKGVGMLYIKDNTTIVPTQTGGNHESGLRAGTLNVPLIVGLSVALEISQENRVHFSDDLTKLRNRIIDFVIRNIPDAVLTGHPSHRLPNHASFAFKGVDGNNLLAALDIEGFACSSGSACKTGLPEPSDVLLALGLSPDWALGSLRISLGKYTTEEEVEAFLRHLPVAVARLRD